MRLHLGFLLLLASALPFTAAAIPLVKSSVKICTIFGEFERGSGKPVLNKTETRYKMKGADLGASFVHKGRIYYVFGDGFGTEESKQPWDGDPIGWSEDFDPEDCLAMDFKSKEGDWGILVVLDPESGEPIPTGPYNVSTGGFSANGKMYVLKTTDGNTRSVLASSEDAEADWKGVCNFSRSHMINVAPLVEENSQRVYYWGTGAYRKSSPYLAYAPLSAVDDPAARKFLSGINSVSGEPIWSSSEEQAVPLFQQDCMGELSVGFNPVLKKYMMLYNCGLPRPVILLRLAPNPWGPWSEPEVLFEGWRDMGYCDFMHHKNTGPGGGPLPENCLTARDPWDENMGESYGPYVINAFTKAGEKPGQSVIYYLMSTWNPYNVVLMRSVVEEQTRALVLPSAVQ